MRKVQLNEEIKSFTKTVNGLSVLNISTYSKNILNFLFDYQYLPLSEEQLKKIGKDKVNREFTDKMIYTALKINPKTFSKSINELVEAGYLTISDDLMMLNISKMVKDIHTINTSQIMPILKKGKINELEDLIIEKDKKYFQKLEKLIAVGAADEDDLKEYNELKTLLHGSDAIKEADLEVKEQETITNTTTEIKAEKQAKTVNKETAIEEVEETTKEADLIEAVLNDKKEIEHKDTTSTPEAEKPAKTGQKEVIKEDTSNDINKYRNLSLELNNYQIPTYKEDTSNDTEVDNKEEVKTNEMITQETVDLFNELLQLTEGTDLNSKKENIRIKISDWKRRNEKNYSSDYYRDIALNQFLKEEIENYKIYDTVSDVEEVKVIEDYSNEETRIRNSNDSYAEALKILINRYSNDNLNEEEITKEFNSFFGTFYEKKSLNDVLFVYEQVRSKYGKNAA